MGSIKYIARLIYFYLKWSEEMMLLFPLMLSSIHCLTICQPKPPIYIHDKIVKSKKSTFVPLKHYQPKRFNVTYIPQQVVKVRNTSKRLPIHNYAYKHGMQYLKYIAENKKTDDLAKKAVELLVCTEPLGKQMYTLLNNEQPLSAHDKVVRIYRKIYSQQNKAITWKPIMTVPAQNFKKHIQTHLNVSPKGKLHLENI